MERPIEYAVHNRMGIGTDGVKRLMVQTAADLSSAFAKARTQQRLAEMMPPGTQQRIEAVRAIAMLREVKHKASGLLSCAINRTTNTEMLNGATRRELREMTDFVDKVPGAAEWPE